MTGNKILYSLEKQKPAVNGPLYGKLEKTYDALILVSRINLSQHRRKVFVRWENVKEMVICKRCLESLQSLGPGFPNLFFEFCIYYVYQKKPKVFCTNDEHNLNEIVGLNAKVEVMEKNGFILTSEISQGYIGAIPQGLHTSECGECILLCIDSKHFEEDETD